jgi:hypothetical protein
MKPPDRRGEARLPSNESIDPKSRGAKIGTERARERERERETEAARLDVNASHRPWRRSLPVLVANTTDKQTPKGKEKEKGKRKKEKKGNF